MNDFNALQKSIAEAMISSGEDLPVEKKDRRTIHKLFLKRKKARKVAKLSRRKNRN